MEHNHDWDELINYLDRVRPGFRTRIRPATSAQLTEFEDIIGRPIYAAFRGYLERMGADDDCLYLNETGYSLQIDDLIENAVEIRDVDCGPDFFKNYLSLGSTAALWYGLRVSGEHAGRVIRLHRCEEDPRYTPHIADSMFGYVFGYGFSQEMTQLAPQWSVLTAPANIRAKVISQLTSEFEAERYSDSVNWYGRAPHSLAGIWYNPDDANELDIRISARSADASMTLAEHMARELKLNPPVLFDHS